MNVLLLTPYPDALAPALVSSKDSFIVKTDPVNLRFCIDNQVEFLVSYGYRHMISIDILDHFPLRAVNLHISMLPRSRGAHPNFWSILEGAQAGVTIHLLDKGLDTGNILFQKKVIICDDMHTFETSYRLLCCEVEELFMVKWDCIRLSEFHGRPQRGKATYHRSAEIEQWFDCLPQMWATPISLFKRLAAQKSGPANPLIV